MTTKMTLLGAAVFAVLVVVGCGRTDAPAAATGASPAHAAVFERLDVPVGDVPEGGNCSLDTINGQPIAAASLKAGDEAVIVGWVGDPQGQVPGDARLLLAGDGVSYAARLIPDIDRPDVATALQQPGLARSGFGLSTVLAVEPGDYRISTLMGSPATVHCQFDVQVTVAAP